MAPPAQSERGASVCAATELALTLDDPERGAAVGLDYCNRWGKRAYPDARAVLVRLVQLGSEGRSARGRLTPLLPSNGSTPR